MQDSRKGLGLQITLYIGGVVCFLMGFFLLVDYFSQQGLALHYLTELDDDSIESAVHNMARHMLARRAAYMSFILIAVMGATWLVVKIVVVKPIDLLFMHQYTASRGNLQRAPFPTVQNEFADLYDMFNHMVERLNKQRDNSIIDARRAVLNQTCNDLQKPLARIVRQVDTIISTNRLDAELAKQISSIRHEAAAVSERIEALLLASNEQDVHDEPEPSAGD